MKGLAILLFLTCSLFAQLPRPGGSSVVAVSTSLSVSGDLSSATGGFGSIQNLLTWSSCFDCGTWSTTNITINGTNLDGPSGDSFNDNDLTSTVNGAFISEFYDTGAVLTARTFTFFVWLKVPTTPVTSRLTILSNTPTTAVTSTVAVTTSWQRFSVTGTFSIDAGHQVGVRIVPVDGGQGLVYAWGAQLQEKSTPGASCQTFDQPFPDKTWGICAGEGGLGNQGAQYANFATMGMMLGQNFCNAAFSPCTLSPETFLMRCDTTDGNVTVSLPGGSTFHGPPFAPGQIYGIKKTASANTCTVNVTGGSTIDGGASVALAGLGGLFVMNDGANNWMVIAKN